MKKLFCVVFLLVSTLHSISQTIGKRTVTLMGSRWDITIVASDSAAAQKYIDTVIAEVSRIEYLISDWKPQTQISQVNRNAGIAPVKVDKEVFELTERAIELSKLTNGAFDISFAAMDRIWKFDGSMTEMPSPEAVKKSVEKVGYKDIILNKENGTIFLKRPGMKIGFGALGEGYAADRCREMMQAKGVKAGIVNGSGDMAVWGKQPDGSDWKIGITNPLDKNKIFKVISMHQNAVVTSGSYEKFVMFDGKRYSHIINPATGYPATGVSSVTVFGPSTEKANGFSTSMMVLGKDAGIELIKGFPEYSYILITDAGRIYSSESLKVRKKRLRY